MNSQTLRANSENQQRKLQLWWAYTQIADCMQQYTYLEGFFQGFHLSSVSRLFQQEIHSTHLGNFQKTQLFFKKLVRSQLSPLGKLLCKSNQQTLLRKLGYLGKPMSTTDDVFVHSVRPTWNKSSILVISAYMIIDICFYFTQQADSIPKGKQL